MSVCCFSSDAAGHLLSLDIDLYFNGANTTKNNTSIMSWGHVSPRTFGVLLANPFFPEQGIHYTVRLINAKMSCMHIWGWKLFRGQDTIRVHVSVYLSVCKRKVLSLFFILGISALEGLGGAVKSNASRSHDPHSVIVSFSARNESSVRPFLNTQG